MTNAGKKKVRNLASTDQVESGAIKVHESVISSIVRKAVLGTKGVVRFSGNSFVDNIAEFVGSKSMMDRAISVEMGAGSVSVEVQVIMQYGVYIPDVANKVQEKIRTQVQEMTGIPVEKANVVIMDIEKDDAEEEEDANS